MLDKFSISRNQWKYFSANYCHYRLVENIISRTLLLPDWAFSNLEWSSEGGRQLRAGRPGFDSQQCKIFLFSTASRPTLGPTQPPIQCVPGAHYWG
jgi:hypothetical protein